MQILILEKFFNYNIYWQFSYKIFKMNLFMKYLFFKNNFCNKQNNNFQIIERISWSNLIFNLHFVCDRRRNFFIIKTNHLSILFQSASTDRTELDQNSFVFKTYLE